MYFSRNFEVNDSKFLELFNPIATGNTPVCDWIFESVDDINVHEVTRKHFFEFL